MFLFYTLFIAFQGTGGWDSCVSEIVGILKSAGDCGDALKCFFDGIEAPPVDLSSIELYGFSEYWVSLIYLYFVSFVGFSILCMTFLHSGEFITTTFSRKEQENSVQHRGSISRFFERTDFIYLVQFQTDKAYPNADLNRLEGQCFKSAWIHAILHDGFHVNELKHKFQTALRIRDQEVQWALGALVYQIRHFPLGDMQKNYIHA